MRRHVPRLALAVIVAAFLVTGLQGIDFGTHWDEQSLANRVKWSVEHGGTLLPGSYDWPSVSYWLAVVSLVPEAAMPASFAAADATALERHLVARLDSREYRLRLRRVFLFVASLALVGSFFAAALWSRSEWAGVAAAATLAGSWQFAYHARWPAPDGPLVAVVSLIVCGAVLTRTHPGSPRGAQLAAIGCGLAIGTKYTAWPFSVMWLASDVAWRLQRNERWLLPAVRGTAMAVAVFVVTTPGVVLQPFQFVASLAYLGRHYSADATVLAPYLVGAGWPMLSASLSYVLAVLWSPWVPVAVLISAAALAGVWTIAARDRTLALLIGGAPVLLLVSLALQPVLLVRNLLPLAAPLAVAVSAGLMAAATRAPRWRPAVAALGTAIVLAHTAFLVYAAQTISSPHDAAARPTAGAVTPASVDLYPPPVLNRPRVMGALDVDVLYYPTWLGSPHLVVLQ